MCKLTGCSLFLHKKHHHEGENGAGYHPRAWGEGSALALSCFRIVSDDEMVWGGAVGIPVQALRWAG